MKKAYEDGNQRELRAKAWLESEFKIQTSQGKRKLADFLLNDFVWK